MKKDPNHNGSLGIAISEAVEEAIIVAPESAHAVKAVIDDALIYKNTNREKVIVFNLSGHGHFDLTSYEDYQNQQLVDYEYPEAKVREAIAELPKI